MKPGTLLLDYLAGRRNAHELHSQLESNHSRTARRVLAIVRLDEHCRYLLRSFAPSQEVRNQLAQAVVEIETWTKFPNRETVSTLKPSRSWLQRLTPTFDVVGHATATTPQKKSKGHRHENTKPKTKSRPDAHKNK